MTPTERQNACTGGQVAVGTRPMFHRVLRAHPVTVRDTLIAIRGRFRGRISEDTLGRLELVLAEVMNNVAKHARPRPAPGRDGPGHDGQGRAGAEEAPLIHLCIVQHDTGLACAITDDGVSVPDECLLPRSLPQGEAGDLPEGGFGWYLIQDLTQALCYYRERKRNFLAFCVPFGTPQLPLS